MRQGQVSPTGPLKTRAAPADMRRMESLLSWIGIGLAGLLGVAVIVAWWEHLGRNIGPLPVAPATARAVSVDVPLDAWPAPAGDANERRATLGQAMDRMGQARAQGEAWVETRPMVTPGTTAGTTPGATPEAASSATSPSTP